MSKLQSYIKKTFYEDDEIKIVLEEADSHLMAHLTIYKSSKKNIKLAQGIWEEIKTRAYFQGYEYIYTYTKDNRMLKLFPGGEIIGDCEYNDERYAVVRWVLN